MAADKPKAQKRVSRNKSKTSAQKLHKCRRKPTKHDTLNPAYWEAKLKRMKLTMDAGTNRDYESGKGYTLQDLAYISDERQIRGHNHRVVVTGESLEQGEWPVSLC